VSQKLLISDANILIDMIVGGLLDDILRLDYEFGLPDVLLEYELRENHADLPEKGLLSMQTALLVFLAAATGAGVIAANFGFSVFDRS